MVASGFEGGHGYGRGNVVLKVALKVALKSIVDDTRGCRVVWNGLNMFGYPPSCFLYVLTLPRKVIRWFRVVLMWT